ncbi:uncharacterized protein LOC141693395 [Apium graveolens]|uniref:uncharacterized protein LOC141693395 n=1 Tax=Apium graveolens TaxID=4045 RepID=UPI003D7B3298
MAMLAKQSWRLLTEVNTLVSAVKKSRYYPQTELIDAELGNNPSYVWREIFASLEILKIGVRRRIGNGESTLVWRDPWLPDILSGYIRIVTYDQLQNIKECLPINAALYGRYVEVEPTCSWCHSAAETGVHIMFLCDFAHTLWRAEGLYALLHCNEYENPKMVFDRVFNQGSKEQYLEVSMLCWSLWHERNMWVWERANGSIFGVRNTTTCLLRDWTKALLGN